MFVLRRFIAVALLALWLPATLHCAIEAAGIEFTAHDDHHASTSCKDVCTDDACHSIEGVSLNKTNSGLRACPPAIASLDNFLFNLLSPPLATDRLTVPFAHDPPEVQRLHRTWQFVRRAALPARAPDLIA